MSEKYLYLSLIPEALIASMLTPEEFGSYYATGAKFNAQGEAIFFKVKARVPYRTVPSGFFVGDQHDFAFYRFPAIDELERDHHAWWRSAQTTCYP